MLTAGASFGGETDVDRLEALVAQWVRLRAETAEEKRVWREQKDQLNEEIALLEKEKADLVRALDQARETSSEADAARARLRSRRNELQDAQDALLPLLDQSEAAARAWMPRVPVSLQDSLREAFSRIPHTHQEAERMTPSRRMQIVVAFYTALEGLQSSVHVVKEMLSTEDGKRREMDVLYIGLARGFAVTPDSTWAAVGVPGEKGWQWRPDASIAPSVRRGIEVHQRAKPAVLVPLPLEVTGGKGETP